MVLNQVATEESSRFTTSVNSEIFLCLKKILVSSAKRINERSLEHEKMSFIYNRNRRRPNTES